MELTYHRKGGKKIRPGDDVEAEGLHYGVRYAD